MKIKGSKYEADDFYLGGAGDNTITGTGRSDVVDGGSGRDTLTGGGGRDYVLGGSGSDIVDGGGGRDVVRGGSGNDVVRGGAEDDFLLGDSGNDEIVGGHGWDRLFGGTGNDFLKGGDGNDILMGGVGDDVMIGGRGVDHFVYLENAGRDVIHEFDLARDVVDLRLLPEAIAFADLTIVDNNEESGVRIKHAALDGSIEIKGISASDLSASNFKMPDGQTDRIVIDGVWIDRPNDQDPKEGSDASQLMMNSEVDGHILAKGGLDRVFGGEGDDRIEGGYSRDYLYGEEGNDFLYGNTGSDWLFGGEGNDHLFGGSLDDLLVGGEGNDVLEGGTGSDTFVFGQDHGTDTVADFENGKDVFDVSGLTGIRDFEDLRITADRTTAVIDLTGYGGGMVRLEDTAVRELGAEDFMFYEPPAGSMAFETM